MAQQKKAPKGQDPYVSRGKTLASSVQRLRGWVGSDPSRTAELADALVELTAHRLLGHGYAAAGADAQEAVRYAAQLLTANGPIGPYTSAADAARYVTAVVHVATIQTGVDLAEAAGRTLSSLHDTRAQLDEVQIRLQLDPSAAIWALVAEARSALVAGRVAEANAYADAALASWAESALVDESEATYLALDVERLASDVRWAAGRAEEALGYLLSAKDRYDTYAADRLSEPARLAEAVLQRLAEPLFGLYSDIADLLMASDEGDLGLAVRRNLIETLRGVENRLGDPVRQELTAAEAALAGGRDIRPAGTPVSWEPFAVAASYSTVTTQPPGRPVDPRSLDVERRRTAATWLAANRDDARRSEQQRRDADQAEARLRDVAQRSAEAAAAEREAAERAEADAAARLEAERAAAAEEAERQERKRRREERLEAHRLEVERREAEQREAERQEQERRDAELRSADPAEAERRELERLQAELADLERAEAERVERERVERERVERERDAAERAEAERVEAERAEAERVEAERVELERARAERAEAERVEAERAELERLQMEQAEQERVESNRAEMERADIERQAAAVKAAEQEELAVAVREWQGAKASGGRRAVRDASERVVELLRPRARADPPTYGPQLRSALEELSRARLRAGDLLGSRAPAKEAKALAETLPTDIG